MALRNESIESQIRTIRQELKKKLTNAEKDSEESKLACSMILAQRLQSLQQELDESFK